MSVSPIQFLMVGGFLGAGKTTTIARLARHFIDAGHRVGLVTNDQAYDLVDTQSLRAQGFEVGEVAGACFCCKFEDLMDAMRALSATERPDLIIAEPVGSCTDLVATVLEPMQAIYGADFRPGRFAVLLKPEHGLKILRKQPQLGFSEQAAYIFRKQLEEADIVVINKIDQLSNSLLAELEALITDQLPGKPQLRFSAKTGAGFAELLDQLQRPAEDNRILMDVDYDVYAEGEAELGWLNATLEFRSPTPTRLDNVALAVAQAIQDRLNSAKLEIAHLKVLASDGDSNAVIVNLVGAGVAVDLSVDSEALARRVELTVNARVATDPDSLDQIVRSAAAASANGLAATVSIRRLQKLSPGRPVPTHRVTS